MNDKIIIKGAKEHNLKNINLETKRQLALKNKVLDIARYDALLGNKMYNEYWKDCNT